MVFGQTYPSHQGLRLSPARIRQYLRTPGRLLGGEWYDREDPEIQCSSLDREGIWLAQGNRETLPLDTPNASHNLHQGMESGILFGIRMWFRLRNQ